ncbi:class I SAM-dependent methyltransferase [Streptomyces sp. SL13]|uniref:Class I SAM-dependent methyltransferase n=1 Tax=Streptantibioticus silvisoli TaxID=2705255 RepID=A0AA90KFG2_9ACTN|nr:class I SAM-dependent methyltransferase [Streptantibioticus silvisoli]MDI5969240.1 class I SAM-dependent methyltransferase [Streptantibioticus silvisoli]
MPIDFHDEAQRLTYAARDAGAAWRHAMRALLDPAGLRVADIGCGGGVYCAAWRDLGAARVVGVDFSAAMLSGARERLAGVDGVTLRQGDACATGLDDASADVVFARALVHHLDDLTACFREAARILAPAGTLIVQDRTLQDAVRPGSPSHLRGYFFEAFPRLLDVERARRPSRQAVGDALARAGFARVRTRALAEERRTYDDRAEVRDDLLARTGRSILHELHDAELARLADHVTAALPSSGPIHETDHWTVWAATR